MILLAFGKHLVLRYDALDGVLPCRLACDHIIIKSFQDSRKYADDFESLRVIYNFSKAFDANDYKSSERDVGQFRRDMALLRLDVLEISKLLLSKITISGF